MEELLLMEILTLAETDHGCVVFLRPTEQNIVIPLLIGQLELNSIIIGWGGGDPTSRPLTHDLLLSILKQLRVTLRRVEIHSLIDDTFHARLILESKETSARNPLAIDCRPSDALALAVRKKCPIYMSAKLIKKTGMSFDCFLDEIEASASDQHESSPQLQYHHLSTQLNRAIEAEEYERAAEIRDMLLKLGNEQ